MFRLTLYIPLVIILIFLTQLKIPAKGIFSSYELKLKIIDLNNKPLINKQVIIFNDTLLTDSLGVVVINIEYRIIDSFTQKQHNVKGINEKVNPKYINVYCEGQYFFLKNKWKRYIKSKSKRYCEEIKVYVHQ